MIYIAFFLLLLAYIYIQVQNAIIKQQSANFKDMAQEYETAMQINKFTLESKDRIIKAYGDAIDAHVAVVEAATFDVQDWAKKIQEDKI